MKRKQVKKLLLLALCAYMAAGPAQASVYADTGVLQVQTEDQTEDEKDDLSVQENEENAIQTDVLETAASRRLSAQKRSRKKIRGSRRRVPVCLCCQMTAEIMH